MRVEISYKFIMGFIIVVGSIVLVNVLVPYLGIPADWQQLFTVACAILVGLVLGWVFSKAFTANIRILTEAAERLSHGDLTRNVRLRESLLVDETADLAGSLNRVVDSLRELVGYIRSSSVKVAESSQGLSATSQQMSASTQDVTKTVEQISEGAETQAEMVEKSSQFIKEMAVSIDLIAASAHKLAASASDTARVAQHGGEMAGATMKKMNQVLDGVERNGKQMASFGGQVQKIGKIVDVITGIAQKTNLLAMNATIEAARAGEYGRGFAVVAEEISKLADSAGESAGEITDLVESIREESQQVQVSIQESIQEIGSGREAVDTTGSAFEEIIQNANLTRTKATSIAELSDTQTEGARNMVAAIEEISRVVTDNAAATQQVSAATEQQSASMEEMAQSAGDLSALAEDLLNVVSKFQLGGEKSEA
ncbi:MAG: methyl-accepting chemotaxis protein [Desulfuromonas sp.]|uniref:methyl-accepting chemotaxis protein n=1 Tax=Desulfuromonas sp. TaxID=892 RepID=UPI000CC3B9BD|nr:HAMP domain-containing methyl-accepting chemotaxis protein [Desulfuromonas sp.]PLX83518.1 MAG: methyl-accepting chemotaxis protein [Desulfuromonas sp.]